MAPVDQLFHLFGGLRPCQRAIGAKYAGTLQGWQKAGRVPWWWEVHIRNAAAVRKIKLPAKLMERLFSDARAKAA